jgi:hypothetical protein
MNWIIATYLLALVYLSTHQERLPKRVSLHGAWFWFSLMPIGQFVFSLLRAANIRDPRDLALVEIWADGVGWLLLGISLLSLTGSIAAVQAQPAGGGGGGGGDKPQTGPESPPSGTNP